MRQFAHPAAWIWFALAALAAPAIGAAQAGDSPSRLIDFSLKDQFDTVRTNEDVRGRLVLLIGSDGEGSEFNDPWGKAINQAIADHPSHAEIYQIPYADLRSVPFFARGFARGMMPEAPEEWVLLDWKGRIAKHYDFAAGATNVLVFDRNGALLYQTAGREPDPQAVERIAAILKTELSSD